MDTLYVIGLLTLRLVVPLAIALGMSALLQFVGLVTPVARPPKNW